MCGILGTYNLPLDFDKCLSKQSHRGPDAFDSRVYPLSTGIDLKLGHNRLKIICLSDDANQPFSDKEGRHHLTYNGEIYNYLEIQQELKAHGVIFRTQSDSEVLLEALKYWGMKALSKLNGMFAFAYYNAETEDLFLVRDRFGVKPLYYFSDEKRLMFASTSFVIAEALALQPNYGYLKKGVQYGIFEDDTESTVYQDLKSVRPGTFLHCRLQTPLIKREFAYYSLSKSVDELSSRLKAQSPQQLKETVFETLSNANQKRLQADVPVALTLSGGLDSSTLAVLSKEKNANIQAFCFGNPALKQSEGHLAKLFTDELQLKTHFVMPDIKDWSDAFIKTLEHQNAPFAGISVVAQYLLYENIKASGFKVVLGGQGGDEAFLGYRKFQLFYLKSLLLNRQWPTAMLYTPAFLQMLWAERVRLKTFWKLRSKFGAHGLRTDLTLPGERAALNLNLDKSLQARQIADVLQFSLPTLLRYEDRNSMAHGIESRLPFLDYRVIALGAALPLSMNLRAGFGKWVIRDLMAEKIPNAIRLARYKRGFDVPGSLEIYESLSGCIQERLQLNIAFYESMLPGQRLSTYFSSVNLQRIPQRFTELTVLLWLGMRFK